MQEVAQIVIDAADEAEAEDVANELDDGGGLSWQEAFWSSAVYSTTFRIEEVDNSEAVTHHRVDDEDIHPGYRFTDFPDWVEAN
jgi:hypothetical protein